MLVFYDLRLLPAALGAWLLIAILLGSSAHTVLLWAGALVVMGLLVALLSALVKTGTKPSFLLSIGLTLIVTGLALGICAGHLAKVQGSNIAQLASSGFHVEVVGKVVSEPAQVKTSPADRPSYRFVLDVQELNARGSQRSVSVPVLVVMGSDPAGLGIHYGATIKAQGNLKETEPGQAQHARMYVQGATEVVREPGGVDRVTNALRAGLMARTEGLSPQGRGLVPGAGIGDTSALETELSDAMKTTSLTHITAVSGSHFAIIFTVVAAGLWFCPRWLRVILIAVTMVGFVALVHPEPSVQRAAVMCGAMVFAMTLGRPGTSITSWAVAIMVLLILDPWLARQYGFVLSVLATGGLILGTAPIARFLHNDQHPRWWLPNRLALIVAVPIAAQMACAPILILLEPHISLYAVPANLLAAPALFPATLASVGAAVLGPLSAPVANLLVQVSSGATWWIAKVALFFAQLPGAHVSWWPGWTGVAALAGVTAAGAFFILSPPARLRQLGQRLAGLLPLKFQQFLAHPPELLSHSKKWFITLGYILGCAAAINLVVWLKPPWLTGLAGTSHFGSEWQVAVCDVGQGDGLLINLGSGHALMIDTGPPDAQIAHCLSQFGIDTIEVLFLTHFHADHTGGVSQVLRNATVNRVLAPPIGFAGPDKDRAETVTAVLSDYGMALETVTAPLDGLHADLTWQILGPSTGLAATLGHQELLGGQVHNDSSLVVDVRYPTSQGVVPMIFLGDLELPGQAALLATLKNSADVTYELVKIAHHGSGVQDPNLLRYLDPSLAVMSYGQDNSYGHPHQYALELIEQTGALTWDTAVCGSFGVSHTADGWFVVADCP